MQLPRSLNRLGNNVQIVLSALLLFAAALLANELCGYCQVGQALAAQNEAIATLETDRASETDLSNLAMIDLSLAALEAARSNLLAWLENNPNGCTCEPDEEPTNPPEDVCPLCFAPISQCQCMPMPPEEHLCGICYQPWSQCGGEHLP